MTQTNVKEVATEDEFAKGIAAMTPEQLSARILKQVEFYFCDSNIVKDKFLKGKVAENEEGWVEIAVIASFKRMKAMSEDMKVIVDSLKKSKSLLKVSEDGTKVKRTSPIPENFNAEPCTCRVKEIPESASLDEIEDFFQARVAPAGSVRRVKKLHDRQTKAFIGKAFVEFDSEETAKSQHNAVVEGGEQKEVLFKEAKITIEHVPLWKARKGKKGGNKKNNKRKDNGSTDDRDKEFKIEKVPDRILLITGLPEGAQWNDIKDALKPFGGVRFVEIANGTAHVRLHNGNDGGAGTAELSAKKCAESFTAAGALVGEARVAVKALGGEEEEKYWARAIETMKAAEKAKGGHKRRRRT